MSGGGLSLVAVGRRPDGGQLRGRTAGVVVAGVAEGGVPVARTVTVEHARLCPRPTTPAAGGGAPEPGGGGGGGEEHGRYCGGIKKRTTSFLTDPSHLYVAPA